MKITLTVSGGFTGVGGKWQIDTASGAARQRIGSDELESLGQLVAEARSAGVFGNDYSAAAQPGAARTSVAPPDAIPADFQTYELQIGGERVRWSEPAPASGAAAPSLVKQLKQRIMLHAPRQPSQAR